jgi:hypothetical protein
VLDGVGSGPVNHVAVPSEVSPDYAPKGRSLVYASSCEATEGDDLSIDALFRAQMRRWFGPSVDAWRTLRVVRVRKALPRVGPRDGSRPPALPCRISARRFMAGDHLTTSSINGALASDAAPPKRWLRRRRLTRRPERVMNRIFLLAIVGLLAANPAAAQDTDKKAPESRPESRPAAIERVGGDLKASVEAWQGKDGTYYKSGACTVTTPLPEAARPTPPERSNSRPTPASAAPKLSGTKSPTPE